MPATPRPITLGAFQIFRVIEMELPFLTLDEMFPASTADEVTAMLPLLQPWCVDADRRVLVAVQSYLVKTPDDVIVLDTCIGCDKTNDRFPFWAGRSDTAWLDRLRATGHRPEDVTLVLCSHLHTDHAGWNTRRLDGRWVPTFPNATYMFSKREVQHCSDAEPDLYRESVLPVIESGHARLVDIDHEAGGDTRIAAGVWLEPTPGHTPGHVAIHLESEGQRAVMWGDLCHSPAQCLRPDWSYRRDWDGAASGATRARVLQTCADGRHMVLSSHFPPPSVGRIQARDQGYWFDYDREQET